MKHLKLFEEYTSQLEIPFSDKEIHNNQELIKLAEKEYSSNKTSSNTFSEGHIVLRSEIKDNKIAQSKSKYNKDIQNSEMNLVSGWFKKYFEEKSLNENIENDTKTYT